MRKILSKEVIEWAAEQKISGLSWTELSVAFHNKYPEIDIADRSIRTAVARNDKYIGHYKNRDKGKIGQNPQNKNTIEINRDGTQTSERFAKIYREEQLKDDKFLLELHGYDPAKWEMVGAKSSIWNSGIKEQTGENQTQTTIYDLYSSKITVRKKPDGINEPETLEHFVEQAAKYSPVEPRTIKQSACNIMILDPVDEHFGQLSWGEESGENYDFKIATQRHKDVIYDVITKTPYKEYEKIYYVFGNDFFNTDNMQGATTAGTQQTNDVRPQKMFEKGIELQVWTIDILREAFPQTPIELILVPGNHDTLTAYYGAKYLNAWFRNDLSVTIDISPKLHKGISYGETAILFTHGQHELKNLEWVYTEFRHLIGGTKTTEIHCGHIHRIKVEEKNGATVRTNPTTAALDNWSYREGYRSTAQAITRVYSKRGLEYEIYSRVQ